MDCFANEKDYMLLDSDKYTFYLLKRLLGGENKLLLTDHERLIICFSCEPYPVWIWSADDLAEEELERAYLICREQNLFDGKHRFNLKYELAEYFIKRAATDGTRFVIETNMFAYDNPKPIAPDAACEGELYQCTAGDIDELVEFMDMFHTDVNMDHQTLEEYRKKASQGVENGSLYFWKDAFGKRVASCNWSQNGDLAAIGLVYTRREERRKHYAENLVYQVTMIARNAGFMPMLYTDADYVASNACYEKIGYILRGKLCTIGPQMEYRKVFDTIPEQFDKFRPRYSPELFEYFIKEAGIVAQTKVLEIGPGTGQATDPILGTGCDYNAIELGEHLYEKMKEKYGTRPNFHIVNDDFITHDFGGQRFDVIYSAATIQWIPEKVAFSKTFKLLKPGGTLAMMFLIGDYKTPNEELYSNIQKVYDEYYKPVTEYKNMKEPFDYLHATDYGYVDLTRHDFYGKRTFSADEYVMYCGTHSDHILIPEPYKTKFFEGLRSVALSGGDKVEFWDTYVLYLTKKPA